MATGKTDQCILQWCAAHFDSVSSECGLMRVPPKVEGIMFDITHVNAVRQRVIFTVACVVRPR